MNSAALFHNQSGIQYDVGSSNTNVDSVIMVTTLMWVATSIGGGSFWGGERLGRCEGLQVAPSTKIPELGRDPRRREGNGPMYRFQASWRGQVVATPVDERTLPVIYRSTCAMYEILSERTNFSIDVCVLPIADACFA